MEYDHDPTSGGFARGTKEESKENKWKWNWIKKRFDNKGHKENVYKSNELQIFSHEY